MTMKHALEQINRMQRGQALPEFSSIRYGFKGIGDEYVNYQVKQVHGVDIYNVNDTTEVEDLAHKEADGLCTRSVSKVIAVKTADCLPVLLWSEREGMAMALHAGWRGLTKGILEKGLQQFRNVEDVKGVMGPSICIEHYEVGRDVIDALEASSISETSVSLCLRSSRPSHWMFDLRKAGVLSLLESGLSPRNLWVHDDCTFHDKERWHSYRRDGKPVGRNWSWITLL